MRIKEEQPKQTQQTRQTQQTQQTQQLNQEKQLNHNEFKLLTALLSIKNTTQNNEIISQRNLAEHTELSLGSINSAIKSAKNKNLIALTNGLHITKQGMQSLEPYKVHNAIIMAAGFSSRFSPISYEKPKGLIKVRGEVLIERQIKQLHEAGINNITVVVGYKQEQFFYLEDSFNVKIKTNSEYSTRNNNSSIKAVSNQLSNIISVHQIIILTKTHLNNTFGKLIIQLNITQDTLKNGAYLMERTIALRKLLLAVATLGT